MDANTKSQELIDAISVPDKLTERQVTLAKQFVRSKMQEGFTVSEFCSSNSLSSKTWYSWMENPDFSNYVEEIQGAIIPDDERAAYQELKRKIMGIPYKKSDLTVKEYELFLATFPYLAEEDRRKNMEQRGLTDEKGKGTDSSNSHEKRNALLTKLKGGAE
ncbi:phBC6A51 family helix-turn-helix protein [Guptibacillus hwajinpoensis]|uniref:phBC6A51 family helix-turn-helix protein n=1 Tax=Guptibacillus hwajinpoensis TaxID=208199 RepID=UPI001CD3587D|nr:phBC6A51 family helix-turn-helix protein [Pseudalkalibacillus hwajinpoensis]MCA0992974.1 hypothetical protein [Pseudalkalibacillus hwajinpoensis]